MKLRAGKIDAAAFDKTIFHQTGAQRTEVIAGPQFGVDVSLIDLGNSLAMALTSDPLSLIPSLGLRESAWLSVHLMANDMATTGIAPQYAQFVLNLPDTLTREEFETYWAYIHQYCAELGVAVTGGHTGFIPGQQSTIAGGGTMVAVGDKQTMRVSSKARAGHRILVTKGCAISSSAILALSFPETVKNQLGTACYLEAATAFYQTSSVKDALLAAAAAGEQISAFHDVTEGGVAGAIYEMAVASGNGVVVDYQQVPVGAAQAAVCDLFEIDPLQSIGAGAMLIACEPSAVTAVNATLKQAGISCTDVGEFNDTGKLVWKKGNAFFPMHYASVDPYWAAYFNAIQKNWT